MMKTIPRVAEAVNSIFTLDFRPNGILCVTDQCSSAYTVHVLKSSFRTWNMTCRFLCNAISAQENLRSTSTLYGAFVCTNEASSGIPNIYHIQQIYSHPR